MSTRAKFEQYHRENPEVYEWFREFAYKAKAAGFRVCGVKLLLERVRWYVQIDIKSRDAFKINNDYAPFYARKLMAENRDLEGFFRLRESVADIDEKEWEATVERLSAAYEEA